MISSWEKEIRELEEENRQAFLRKDADRLRRLWADDLVVNSPINKVHGKEVVIDLLVRGVILHSSMETHIEAIQRHEDVVTVMGRDVVVDAPGSPAYHRRFTNVWHGGDGSWLLIARHANRIG